MNLTMIKDEIGSSPVGDIGSAYATGKHGKPVLGDDMCACAARACVDEDIPSFRSDTVIGTNFETDEKEANKMYKAPAMQLMLEMDVAEGGGSMASVTTGAHVGLPGLHTHFFAGASAKESVKVLLSNGESRLIGMLEVPDACMARRGYSERELKLNLSVKKHFGLYILAIATGDEHAPIELHKVYFLQQPSSAAAWGNQEAIILTWTAAINMVRMDRGLPTVFLDTASPIATLLLNRERAERARVDWTGVEQQSAAGAQAHANVRDAKAADPVQHAEDAARALALMQAGEEESKEYKALPAAARSQAGFEEGGARSLGKPTASLPPLTLTEMEPGTDSAKGTAVCSLTRQCFAVYLKRCGVAATCDRLASAVSRAGRDANATSTLTATFITGRGPDSREWRVTIGRADGAEELTQETMPEYGEVTGAKRKANAALASSSRSRAKSRKEVGAKST